MSEAVEFIMSAAQEDKLRNLCERYGVPFDKTHYQPQFDLPLGWCAGWLGGGEHVRLEDGHYVKTIYVGVSPEGDLHS